MSAPLVAKSSVGLGELGRRGLTAMAGASAAVGWTPLAWAQGAFGGEPSLKDRARQKGLLFGSAVRSRSLDESPEFAAAFARECDVLIPEWEAKWGPLRPSPETFNFRTVDRLSAFCEAHDLRFRGHALVWHEHVPKWLGSAVKQNAAELLATHIRTVALHYPRAQSWDVVNEAIATEDLRPDHLRRTVWLEALGPGYVEMAFRLAREANPRCLLVYNDYGLDYADSETRWKRRAVLRLLESLRSKNVPIDVVGIQAHLNPLRRFDAAGLQSFLRELAALDLKIYLTELDVRDRGLPADIEQRDRTVHEHALAYLEAALEIRELSAVFTWGLSDRWSWLNDFPYSRREDGLPCRGHPLDADFQRKPLWRALAKAFDGAASRLA